MGMGGCKTVPADTCPGKPCNCNAAFQINANNTITSVMDGKCVQWNINWLSLFTCVDSDAGSKSDLGPGPLAWQTFNTTASADGKYVTVEQKGLCLDYAVPPTPSPGPRPPGPPSPPAPVIDPATVTFNLRDLNLGLPSRKQVKVRDIWNKRFLPSIAGTGAFSASVPHHGSIFLVFMPENSTWPLPFKLAPWMDKPAPPVPPPTPSP